MDPDQTLREIHEAIAAGEDDRVVVLFVALDGWLRSGGFLPASWYGPMVTRGGEHGAKSTTE